MRIANRICEHSAIPESVTDDPPAKIVSSRRIAICNFAGLSVIARLALKTERLVHKNVKGLEKNRPHKIKIMIREEKSGRGEWI